MPIDYIGMAAALGIYTYALWWLCRLIVRLTPTDRDE